MAQCAHALALVGSTALPATAQSDAENHVVPRLIDMVCADVVDTRNGCETFVLLASGTEPDTADLIIFSDRRANAPQEILIRVPSIAFNGPLFGQAPALEIAQNGSVRLTEEQTGIGRSPWTQVLTIAYRDGAFVVAGRSYSTYDRAAGGGFSCDMNLLTGAWTTSADRPDPESGQTIYEADSSGQIPATRIALTDWNWTRPLPAPCVAGLDAWWAAEAD